MEKFPGRCFYGPGSLRKAKEHIKLYNTIDDPNYSILVRFKQGNLLFY